MPHPTAAGTEPTAGLLVLRDVRVEDAPAPRDLVVVTGRIAPAGAPFPAGAPRIDWA